MTDIWKARLLPASWRGIPFKVTGHEESGGRHAVQHEPPDRDVTSAEDIGKRGKVFRIEGYVLGDNYFFIRDGLINAMDEAGKGTLIHPYRGIKEVQPVGYTLRETTDQGRIGFFTFTFVEAGDPSFPFSAIDAVTDFFTAAVTAVAQIENAFLLAFKIAELPGFAKDSAVSMVASLTSMVDSNFKNVRLDGDQHANLKFKNDEINENRENLVDNPASLISEVDGLIEGLKDLVPDAPEQYTIDSTSGRDDQLAVFNGFLDLSIDDVRTFRGIADLTPESTPTRIIEKQSLQALADATQQLAIVRWAEQTVAKDFKSLDRAIDTRTEISEYIDYFLQQERTSDEVFQVLEDLNAKLIRAVPNTDSEFQNTKTISLEESLPTLVVAYDLYESDENEQDIIDRNAIRNPGFAVGDLEVLAA